MKKSKTEETRPAIGPMALGPIISTVVVAFFIVSLGALCFTAVEERAALSSCLLFQRKRGMKAIGCRAITGSAAIVLPSGLVWLIRFLRSPITVHF